MLRRWALLASFYQTLDNTSRSVNIFTVCQLWLLTNYFRLAIKKHLIHRAAFLPRSILTWQQIEYLSTFCNIFIFLLPHFRRYWQPHNQGGCGEGARVRLDEGRHCEIDRSRFRKLRTKHLLESRGREGTREGFGPKCNFDILEWGGQFFGGNSLCRENPKKRKKSVKEFFHLKAEHVLINAFCPESHLHF